ncbi:MAG: FAD-dependent oxidoreductase [Desulfamplus sp.]|nr:FAD-dependent oxidoreductase [Desulfamplus sp.]
MTQQNNGSVMVVGAGIAGIQASLDLADSGYLVYLVDNNSAIGGVMAKLDKTFPTNDCSMCIISPKLVEAGRHLNIELLNKTHVREVSGTAGNFKVKLLEEPRFIDTDKCTACGECSSVCPVELPNQFDEGLGNRKAAFKLYPQAMPSAYTIEKGDRAPCKLTCPAGLNVQGYVQMVKKGKYKEALEIIMEQLPLPGVLGRICPHECENGCRRGEVDQPIAIRELKRLAADKFDARQIKIECEPLIGKKVAIIGSGPAGLSAAYHLAKKGIKSTIFEALPKAGGMLRVGIPDHRLPPEVLDRDIEVITNLGVEIRLNTPIGDKMTIDSLLADGFDAVFLGMGAHKGIDPAIPGSDLDGVRQGVDYLRELNLTGNTKTGKRVAIIGGGNVAIDVARSAVRLGAEKVTIIYRRTRKEMPAWEEEICAAEHEGVEIIYLSAPQQAIGTTVDESEKADSSTKTSSEGHTTVVQKGKLSAIRCIRMELGEPDSSGRRRPVPVVGSEYDLEIDQLIYAIGQQPDVSGIKETSAAAQSSTGDQSSKDDGKIKETGEIKITKWATTEVNPITFETGKKGVFAGGDLQTGPGVAIAAIAAGMEAAESISRYLKGEDMALGRGKNGNINSSKTINSSEIEMGKEEKDKISGFNLPDYTPISENIPKAERARVRELSLDYRKGNFNEVELGLDEQDGQKEAERCLNCGYCSECMACVDACLAKAVDHSMTPKTYEIEVGAIILSPGFTPFNPAVYETYGYGSNPNIVTSIEFERLLSASGPYKGHLVRPSDEKEPKKIAWLQCVGSRDINRGGHSYCSGVCCMYANKQAVIAKEHSDHDLDTAIFFMDMRTHGKDFDKYNIRAEDESGVRFVRSRIHSIFPMKDDRLRLVYATESGSTAEEIFDMVVLSVGLAPCSDAAQIAQVMGIELNHHQFAKTSNLSPVNTTRDGIFVCGAFQEPKDIPMSVMEASAAAAMAAQTLAGERWSLTRTKELPPERDFSSISPRIGVFVCNCGINIGGVADVPAVRNYAGTLPYVVHVEDNLFTCSQDSQDHIKKVIIDKDINRVVVASCSPRTHEPLFQETIREAGLNKYLFEMANIRDQNTWVHMNSPEKATQKAKDLVRMAVAKAAYVEPLHQVKLAIKKSVLVIGGGISGMEAALSVAEQGFKAILVEKSEELGGNAKHLRATWQGEAIQPWLNELISRVNKNSNIELYLNTEVKNTTGSLGNFITTLSSSISKESKVAKEDLTNITTASGGQTGSSKAGLKSLITVEHGAAIIATGGKEDKPNQYLYGEHPNVLTHLDMDQVLEHADKRLSKAKTVAFIQCVGSRNSDKPYCSKICCTHSLKSAIEVKNRRPGTRVYIIYRDIRSYGFREDLYQEARQKGIIFIRYDLDKLPQVKAIMPQGTEGDTTKYDKDRYGTLELTVIDHVLRMEIKITPDILVLASGIVPNANKHLFEAFKVPVNAEGFLVEAHAKLRPVDFASDGLFVAGLAHYPKPLEECIAQAKASASRAMRIVSRDSIMVGGVVAVVQPEKCAVCLTCVRTCPYGIPYIHEDGYAVIDASECHGCGLCVSECPGKAIKLNHFTDDQIMAKTDALFKAA